MERRPTGSDRYARSVFDDTQRYIQKLLDSNDQARRKLAALEAQHATLERERLAAREEIIDLRETLTRCRQDHSELQGRLREVESVSRGYADEYLQLERRNSNLVNLYVASYGLHGRLDRATVLQSIKEIVINLIGSEELAVLELDGDGFMMADSFGVEAAQCAGLSSTAGLVGRTMATGEPWVEGRSDASERTEAEEHLTACIPLKVEDRVFGALAIFRLLPQKSAGLVDVDHELLDLLAAQAGTALFCSTLFARHGTSSLPTPEPEQ